MSVCVCVCAWVGGWVGGWVGCTLSKYIWMVKWHVYINVQYTVLILQAVYVLKRFIVWVNAKRVGLKFLGVCRHFASCW